MAGQPDPKDGPRKKDPVLLKELHVRWGWCPLCMFDTIYDHGGRLSLHHVLPKGSPYFGDDVEGNLVMLCGSGTTGHHGRIEAGDPITLGLLGGYIEGERKDVIAYVRAKLADPNGDPADADVPGNDWLYRHLRIG